MRKQMNHKRIFPWILIAAFMIVGFSIYSILKIEWKERYPGPPPNASNFNTYELTLIDPATVLDDIRKGKKLVLQTQPEPNPTNPPFMMPISWSQNDFLEVAQAYGQVIWQDDLNSWHLYKILFHGDCDSSDGKFTDADFLYYQEVTKGEEDLYSVHGIELSPEYGWLTWGGDSFYPRPRFFRWAEIDKKSIVKVPAEEALTLAEQRGGSEFRKTVNNNCDISVIMWPAELQRAEWLVTYFGGSTRTEIWIPAR
jgi:hypothetical protein